MRKEFEAGQKVNLDKDMANNSVVTVISQTKNKLYTRVKSEDEEWIVMTYRLTGIE